MEWRAGEHYRICSRGPDQQLNNSIKRAFPFPSAAKKGLPRPDRLTRTLTHETVGVGGVDIQRTGLDAQRQGNFGTPKLQMPAGKEIREIRGLLTVIVYSSDLKL